MRLLVKNKRKNEELAEFPASFVFKNIIGNIFDDRPNCLLF
jgi:hypothetical protein